MIDAFEVDELAVLPQYRGNGHGRALLGELMRCAAPEARAWLLTWSGVPDIIAFYEHIGWKRVAPLKGVDTDIVVFTPGDHPQR